MSAAKRKPPTLRSRQPEEPNRKAIIWTASIIGVVIIGMALLLIFN
ncbi:hypothetical protein ABEV74_06450 [Paenibacillus cisolokensis]|nr:MULTISPECIES: hypothetical protein [Paenibacillus]